MEVLPISSAEETSADEGCPVEMEYLNCKPEPEDETELKE